VRDEAWALALVARQHWYAIAAALALLALLAWLLQPMPPRHIRIASGQPNATTEVVARKYQAWLAREGIKAELVSSRGALENLDLLARGAVHVAIGQGGAPVPPGAAVVSLGSIGYQPLWFFYRGAAPADDDLFGFLRGKRISVGLQGSGTRTVVEAIQALPPARDGARFEPVELAAGPSIAALRSGDIDGLFLLAGMESGNVQTLLGLPGVRVLSFPVADALARLLEFAEVVSVPKGAFRLSPPYPPQDVRMVATTTTLLAQASLHPALQGLLVRASVELQHSEPAFFQRPGGFPAFIDKGTPASPIARRYLAQGPPTLERFLPYWLANLVDAAWVWMLGLLAVAYPLMRLLPSFRKTMFSLSASDKYSAIFELYAALRGPVTASQHAAIARRFAALEQDIQAMWVPKGCKGSYAGLIALLDMLYARLQECAATGAPPDPGEDAGVALAARLQALAGPGSPATLD
jgi:TRAP-type uncharacterized transport system substrate-binding protein